MTEAADPMKAVLRYAQALKAPRSLESVARLGEQARDAGWTHEEHLAAVLSWEASVREVPGAATRIRSAGFRPESHWRTSTSIINPR